ncbi:selenium metabolism-associated LysR family transcriptional regulator [Bacillus tuaregi]|uniref:selenium metabolism-associated LysR family transcriptional regulator n=1 Tax=Bacillus tuaregi TaxID=1816695 RepID=UPI0008F8FFE4|nr:selenium metabolism-associated LysR family transcriptional regulator [Bacillus tuaregi]
MDLHQLYIFTKVVEHRSFSKAAEHVFLSQSTVSSHIHSLEKMFNVTLFDRVGRESVLTPHGEKLYEWALKLLELKDQALLDLSQDMTELKGNIRIAASSVPGQFLIPKMVKQFRRDYQHIVFHINQSTSKNAAEKVINGSVDFGIIGEKYEHDRLRYIPLLKEKLVLISSAGMDFSSPVNIHELVKYPFVMRHSDSGTNALLERFLKENGITHDQLNIIAYTDSSQSLMQFVKEGIGISIMSEIAAREYSGSERIRLYDIEDFYHERFFYLVYNINRTQSVASNKFIEEAKSLI